MLNNITSQLVALNQANINTFARVTAPLLSGTERLVNLQLAAAKSLIEENIKLAQSLSEIKNPQDFGKTVTTLQQPGFDKALNYLNSVYDVVSQTQSELNSVIENSLKEFNSTVSENVEKAVQSAPAGSEVAVASVKSMVAAANSAFDQFSKATKQVIDLAQTVSTSSKKKVA